MKSQINTVLNWKLNKKNNFKKKFDFRANAGNYQVYMLLLLFCFFEESNWKNLQKIFVFSNFFLYMKRSNRRKFLQGCV